MAFGVGIYLVAFLVTFLAVKSLCPVAYYVNLVDQPGGRKRHEGCIPLIGGLGMFVGIFIASYVFLEQPIFIRFFMLAGGLIVFMGMLDDRYDLSSRSRLVGQILVAAIFVYGLDVSILSFGDLFGFGEFRLGFFGALLTVCSLVGAVNAINMLDGMDGLVGTVALTSFCGLAYLFSASGNSTLTLLCLAFLGALSAFLIFNLWGRPTRKLSKVFMGDAGSMFVGLSLAVLLVVGSQGERIAFNPVTALWFVLLPMLDMFTLMYRRIRRGKSPMAPDRTHIHHIFMRAGFSSYQALVILGFAQCILIGTGVVFEVSEVPEYISMFCVVCVVFIYQILLRSAWRFIRWFKRHWFAYT